jgi:hypothetical protein
MEPGGGTVVIEANPFERVVESRTRPGYSVEPASIAWHAVAFKLRGPREGIACIPRAALDQFLTDLDAGRLDDAIHGFLASPASGRVLRAADQTSSPGLFDELASIDAIAPDERRPGRPGRRGRGGGGGATGDRTQKRSRRPPRRALRALLAVGGLIAAAVIVVAVVVVVAQEDDAATVSAGGSTAPGPVDPNAPVTIPGATSPPNPADLPAGAILFQGDSGDEIGCIPCDGAFRVMSIEHPGVTLSGAGGPQETALMSAPLTANGLVTRLGVQLSSADGGKWTLNVRCRSTESPGSSGSPTDVPVNATPGTTGYAMACSVPQGATACVNWSPPEGRLVKAGDRLALAVGNPGDPITQGHFTMHWWFVFIPE